MVKTKTFEIWYPCTYMVAWVQVGFQLMTCDQKECNQCLKQAASFLHDMGSGVWSDGSIKHRRV